MLVFTTSCSSEEEASDYVKVSKTSNQLVNKERSIEMENFREAMIIWMKAKHNPNASNSTDKQSNSLLEDAKSLLEFNGIPFETLEGRQALNDSEIISKAMRLYAQKTSITLNQQP
ncbi:hypothetical protein ACW5R3_01025 [Bizionia sp. KMM 8389]